MSVKLEAPLPLLAATTVLPDPQLNDSLSPKLAVNIERSMNGRRFIYVKRSDRSKLHYEFVLSRMKALELRAFVAAYYRAQIRVTNHLGEVWHVYFASNPFEFEGQGRAGGWPGGAANVVTLEFEGEKVSGVTPEPCD